MKNSYPRATFLLQLFFALVLTTSFAMQVSAQHKGMRGRFGAGGQIDDIGAIPAGVLKYWVADIAPQGLFGITITSTPSLVATAMAAPYEPPLDVDLISFCPAGSNFNPGSFLVLQSDASIVRAEIVPGLEQFFISQFGAPSGLGLAGLDLQFESLQGVTTWGSAFHFYFSPGPVDNHSRSSFLYPVYVWTNNNIYVTRDTGVSWQMDTVGIDAAAIYKLDFDTKNNIYAATNNGLYVQDSVSNIWTKINAYPGANVGRFYCARNGDLLASSYGTLYRSTNGGGNWAPDTIGIQFKAMVDICDDSAGNMYALMNNTQYGTGANRVFRKLAGQNNWTRIDATLSSSLL